MKPLTKTFAAKKVGDTWTVTKNGSVHSGPYFSEREAQAAAKRAAIPSPRYIRWRERNPELYRERQRELMRKRRKKADLIV